MITETGFDNIASLADFQLKRSFFKGRVHLAFAGK
jgi:hypothetical protein